MSDVNGLEQKTCTKCGLPKAIDEFYFVSKASGRRRGDCKSCVYAQTNKWREGNPGKVQEQSKRKALKNRPVRLVKQRLYDASHKEARQVYYASYYEKNKKSIQKKNDANRKKNPLQRIRRRISSSIREMLISNGSGKKSSCAPFLPFTMVELRAHLEQQFEPWMTWDNYGAYRLDEWKDNDVSTWKWQIDHIIPQSDLPYSDMSEENFRKCWTLSNLRPLSAKQNQRDGATKVRHRSRSQTKASEGLL